MAQALQMRGNMAELAGEILVNDQEIHEYRNAQAVALGIDDGFVKSRTLAICNIAYRKFTCNKCQ
jgi:hypothetical protein